MICKHCGTEILDDSKFCKNCGSRVDTRKICPSCQCENIEEAKYCKHCGTPLKSQKKIINLSKGFSIINLASLCFAAFLILFSFAATFTPFLITNGASMSPSSLIDLFSIIDNISSINKSSSLGVYSKVGHLIPNCICLAAILIAMVVCFVMLVLSAVKAVKCGKKKELPNLDSYAICCIATLFCALLITCFNGTTLWLNHTYHLNSLGFGPVILSANIIGFIWIGGRFVASFVLRIIEAKDKNEIISNSFKLVEMILLVTILFQIVVGFITMSLNVEEEELSLNFVLEILPFAFFSDAYERYPSTKQIPNVVISTITFVFVISFVIVMCVFLFKSFHSSLKLKQKASLHYGIVGFILSIVFLVLTCITRVVTMQKGGLADLFMRLLYSFGLSTDEVEGIGVFVSGNVIVGIILGAILLTSEIVWFGLTSKERKKEKQISFL